MAFSLGRAPTASLPQQRKAGPAARSCISSVLPSVQLGGCQPRICVNPWSQDGQTPSARMVRFQAVRADAPTDGALDTNAIQLIADISRIADEGLSKRIDTNLDAGRRPQPPAVSELRNRVASSIRKVSKGLLERDVEVRLMLLAALCGEHLLLLGPPGTAKSELSRRLNGLVGGTYFERLLTRFSVPEELFGPLSMKGLENDEYVRQTDGYLPTAEVAFIDEIFKANSAILNALLTLLNERLFDNGNQRLEVPLLTLVGASNELPESEELDALYDRFLVRRTVSRVSNANVHMLARLASGRLPAAAFTSMPSAASSSSSSDQAEEEAPGAGLTLDDFRGTPAGAYQSVDVPDSVIDLLVELRNWLQDKCEPPVIVSDRRFMKAVQFLQVTAHGDGRDEVNEYDCLLLEHVFGNRPDDAYKVRSRVLELIASDPGAQQAELVMLGLFGRAVRLLNAADGGKGGPELQEAAAEAASLVSLLSARHATLCASLEGPDGGFPDLRNNIWQAPTSAQAAVQTLTPQVTENRKKVEELWKEALTLSTCLSRSVAGGVAPGVLEKLLPKRAKQYAKGISSQAAAVK